MTEEKLKNNKLRELLITTDHAKLVDILLSLHANNLDIQKQLDIIFAGLEESPKKITNMIKKELTSLKRSSKFVEYYESNALAERLDILRLIIEDNLQSKSPEIAFEMMLKFLDLHKNTLERVDDSSGTVRDVFFIACQDLGKLAEHIDQLDSQEIIEMIFSRFTNNGYGIYDEIIQNFKGVLKHQDFDLLEEKLKRVANGKNNFIVRLGLKSIADCKNDVDCYIAACSFKGGICAHDHLDIAERLIKHLRSKEALEWLESTKIPQDHFWQRDVKNLRIQALELEGRYEQAQEERLSWFYETLSPKLYEEILKAGKSDFQKSFRSDAIKRALEFGSPHVGLNFLVKIQEFEKLAEFVRARFNELNGEQYYILRPAADLLKDIDPIAATLLYRKMIEPILDRAKYKYYNYAAKDLVMCGVLSFKIKKWGELQSHNEYLREIAANHKRKIRFWSDYQAALQKPTAKEKKKSKVLFMHE